MEQLYAIRIGPIVTTIREEGWAFIFICTYLFFEYVRPQSIYASIDIVPWVPIVLAFAGDSTMTRLSALKLFKSLIYKHNPVGRKALDAAGQL